MKNQKPVLTISLLISNRPETVRKCIDSICPLLEAIPSELILTDTSKNPEINALCHEYTDKVYEFEWVKDFSKARNFGLEKATGEWFMFLDDDEWFTDVQEFIDFFQSGDYKNYGYAHYLTRNFYDPECTQYADCWVTRMFRRDDDIRYVGKVHEIFSPLRGEEKYLYPTTHHIGYIFLTEEKRQQHSNRNITLLLDELKENPHNIRFQTQLVLEYRFRADWKEEADLCEECLEEAKDVPKSKTSDYIGTFYAGLIEALFYQKKYEESIDVCKQALKDERSREMARALYHLRLAENYVMLENWKLAREYAETYLQEYHALKDNEELLREQSMALLIRYAFEEMNIQKAQAVIVCCDLEEGTLEGLKTYYEDIRWNLNYTVFYEKMLQIMIKAMALLEYDEQFVKILEDACKKEEFKMYACVQAQKWEKHDDTAFQKLAHIFAQVEDEYWFFWYMSAIEEDIQAGRYGVEVAAEDIVLTISLLISNRPDTIPRCLDSLYQIRKLIPSELILIDTSKNPEVHEMLLEYTDKVYEFDWCHDFAKARNYGLAKSSGEWFMFLDDDEWFVDVKELIKFFRSGEYKEYERATYLVRNFYDPEYVQYADCWVSRMNHITEESRFVGKVHEYMEPCIGAEKHIESIAYHSGYVFSTEEQRREHAKRNITLLMEVLKEEPDNIRWQTQLAQEYRSVMDWEQLVEYCKERIDNSVEQQMDDMTRLQFGAFYAGLAEGLVHEERYQDCTVVCENILGDEQANPLLKAHACICLAEAYFEIGDWEKAGVHAEDYLQEEQRLNGTEALSYEQKLVSIVQHAFDPANKKKAFSILICNDLKHGSTKFLHQYYDALEWNEIENYIFEKLPSYLIEAMPMIGYEHIFSQIITDAFKRDDFKIFMCREALKWEEDAKRFAKLAYIFAQAKADFWFIWYMKVVDAASRCDITLLEQMPNDAWEENVRAFVSQANEIQIERVREDLASLFEKQDWQIGYFENIVFERLVIDGPKDLGNLEQYHDILQAYASMETVLDCTVDAAAKIQAYISLESQDSLEALKQLKQAVDACPDFAEGISRFISVYTDLQKQRVRKQHEEMQKLRIQVLEQVHVMRENGQTQAAKQILEQLKQMFPEDLEIATLALLTTKDILS